MFMKFTDLCVTATLAEFFANFISGGKMIGGGCIIKLSRS